MNLQTAIELFKILEGGNVADRNSAQNYFARGYARYIYFGVGDEPNENLKFNLNFGSDSLAFSYLSIGCCMFENEYTERNEEKEIRRIALEKGGEFIEYNHFYEQNRNELSTYYLLLTLRRGITNLIKSFIAASQSQRVNFCFNLKMSDF